MTAAPLPVVIGPDAAAQHLGTALVVDLSKPQVYAEGHLPGAVSLAYDDLVRTDKPVGGLLPDDAHLTALFSGAGLTADRQVIAYDGEGNGRAGRLLWTLHVLGHSRVALLDGGLGLWRESGGAVSRAPVSPQPARFEAHAGGAAVADRDWILAHLGDPRVVLVDTRSRKEYRGEDVRSARGGHVPGAVHFDWLQAMDADRHRRLRDAGTLLREFAALGVTPDREVVTYCQTHHRSSHTYAVLRHLGFPRVRGYPGAWSDWGNSTQVPVATGD